LIEHPNRFCFSIERGVASDTSALASPVMRISRARLLQRSGLVAITHVE